MTEIENRADLFDQAPYPRRNPAQSGSCPNPKLHIPSPPHRPGEEPSFGKFEDRPTDLGRPDVLAPAQDTREHAVRMVRVLDDEHHAAGEWKPEISPEVLRLALEHMARIRAFDDRMLTMQRQGKLSFYLQSKGEEAVSIGAGLALRPSDLLMPSYRQQGLMLVRGATLLDMACQCIGNSRDNVKGRQMPVHYSYKKGNIVSISSPVGTQFPQAVGAAMAAAYRGDDQVVATWLGDGTTAQGDFHYAVNFASVYRPPVILNVVNNQWAISTHCAFATGGRTFAEVGLAYDMPSFRVDGNDILAVYAVTQWAAERARRGGGPTFLEMYTYRAGAHSSSDDPGRYRPKEEFNAWPGGDPIDRLGKHLIGLDEWTQEQQEEMIRDAEKESLQVYKEAEKFGTMSEGPFPSAATIFEDVYADTPWHLKAQRGELGV